MARQGTKLGSGYVYDPETGKLKKGKRRKQAVSEHIRQKSSKKVRVIRRGTT